MDTIQLVEKTYNGLSDAEKKEVFNGLRTNASLYKLKEYVSNRLNLEFDNDTSYYEFAILFWNKLLEWKNDLEDVLSLQEAANSWGLDDSTLRKAIAAGKFQEGEYRKTGRNYIIKKSAMEKVYGEMK